MGIHSEAGTATQRAERVTSPSTAPARLSQTRHGLRGAVPPPEPKRLLLSHLTAFFIAAMALPGLTGSGPAMALPGATGSGPAADDGDVSGKEARPARTKLPKGVSADWWQRVQRGLAAAEYNPSRNSRGLQAPNRAHNLRTYFSPDGIHLRDRMLDRPLVGLSLSGTGRGDALAPVTAGDVARSGKRIEIRRPGIVEWYENTAKGLEQGFTLEGRPDGEGALVLDMAVKHARARLRGDRRCQRRDPCVAHGNAVARTGAARRRRYERRLSGGDRSAADGGTRRHHGFEPGRR
jgi:hypothetical protein